MKPRNLLPLLSLVAMASALASCELLHEKEEPGSIVQLSKMSPDCEFPKLVDLTNKNTVTEAIVYQALDCAQKQIDNAFDSVRGEEKNELSIREIRKLKEKGTIKIEIETDDEWEAVAGFASLFHPKGKPGISQSFFHDIVSWARKYTPIYVRVMHTKDLSQLDFDTDVHTLINAIEDLTHFVSRSGKISLRQILMAADSIKRRTEIETKPDDPDMLEVLEAIWPLKTLFLPNESLFSFNDDLRGDSLREAMNLFFTLLHNADDTLRWFHGFAKPNAVPATLDKEWENLAAIVKNHLLTHTFTPLDPDKLRRAINVSSPKSGLADIVPDIFRINQRLTPEEHKRLTRNGLHPIGIFPLLDHMGELARLLQQSGPIFKETNEFGRFQIRLRDAVKDPLLSKIALKGGFDWDSTWFNTPVEQARAKKPLDQWLTWDENATRLVAREVIKTIFNAFDEDGNGEVPLEGVNSADTKEAVDLAFTFLRLVSLNNKGDDDKKDTVKVANPVMVKPSALYKIIGLIGDRWMPDGNSNKSLNADEFFSVVAVYQDIQEVANNLWGMSNESPDFVRDPNIPSWKQSAYKSRRSFITNLHKAFRPILPNMYAVLEDMGEAARTSMFHTLISVPDTPVNLFAVSNYYWTDPDTPQKPTPATLRQYVTSDAALGPAAVVSMMNRLLILCDKNENGVFEWKEMSCAMPLLLEAGYQTVSSELVDLDPIVHDGSKLVLQMLNNKGLPLTIAKLIAVNGSVKELKISDKVVRAIQDGIVANWQDIAGMTSRMAGQNVSSEQLKLWIRDAKQKYGQCDADHDELLKGQEFDCLATLVLDQIEALIQSAAGDSVPSDTIKFISAALRGSQAFKTAIIMGTQPDDRIDELLDGIPEMNSSPEKIFRVLEEAIRREKPLCQASDC